MARVIDLKSPKKEEPIAHPVVRDQQVLTDSGQKLPYQTLRWIAPDAYRREGAREPYIFAGILVLLALGAIFLQHDVILTVLLALMAVMVIVHVRKAPAPLQVEVSPLSIRLSGRTIGYDELKSFWVQYEPQYDIRELSLHFKKWYLPYMKIQIMDQDPVQIRAILIQFIPEVEHEETMVHSLVRRIGL